jgi:hypothetical protein
MSNNLYDILNKLAAVEQKDQQPVQQPKAKSQLAENIKTVEGQLNEKYMGFKKTVAAIKKGGSADNPEAVAAAIGREKYGKKKFQQAAAQGKKLGEQGVAERSPSRIGSKLAQSDTETFGLQPGRGYDITTPKDWKPGDRPRAVQQLIPTQDKKDHIRSRLGKHRAPVLPEQGVAEGSDTYKQGHAKFHTKTNKQIGPTHYGRGSDKKADSYTKADPRYHEVRPVKEQGVAEGVTPASVSKVLRLIDRHHPEWFDNYGMGEVEDTVVILADMDKFYGLSAVDAMTLVGQELENLYGQQGVAEGSAGVSVRKWANQVRKDHGSDVKFWNRKEGGGAVDSVIAKNSQGETVGVYDRKTGYPTVFEPKQGVAEGSESGPYQVKGGEDGYYVVGPGRKLNSGTVFYDTEDADEVCARLNQKYADSQNKEQGVAEVAPPGAKAERMVKHIKKGYAKDGKLSDKEKGIAYATAWKAHKAGKVEEAVAALRVLANSGMTSQQITEGWEDMMKAVSAKSREEKGTGKFNKKTDPTTGGTVYSRKYNPKTGETDDTENVTAVKRGRGRPKKSAFEQYMQKYEQMLEDADPLGKFIKGLDKGASAKTAPAAQPAPAMGTIKNGVWTADAPKPGEKGVPLPVPVDEADADAASLGRWAGSADPSSGWARTNNPKKDASAASVGRWAGSADPSSGWAKPVDEGDYELEEMMRLAGMEEALKGGQKKLDKNHNGKLDAEDFAMLRGNEEKVDEVSKGEYIQQQDAAAEKAGKDKFTTFGQEFHTDEIDENLIVIPPPAFAKSAEQAKEFGAMAPKEPGKRDPFSPASVPPDEELDEGHETCTECGYTMTECGCDSSMPSQDEGHMNISMNADSDGHQSMTVSVDGEDAVKLAQLLKLAGLGNGEPEAVYQPVEVVVDDAEEDLEEEKDPRYHASTTPDEQVYGTDIQLKGGNGDVAGQEKKMHKHGYQFGDNPIAMRETAARDYESIKVRK